AEIAFINLSDASSLIVSRNLLLAFANLGSGLLYVASEVASCLYAFTDCGETLKSSASSLDLAPAIASCAIIARNSAGTSGTLPRPLLIFLISGSLVGTRGFSSMSSSTNSTSFLSNLSTFEILNLFSSDSNNSSVKIPNPIIIHQINSEYLQIQVF